MEVFEIVCPVSIASLGEYYHGAEATIDVPLLTGDCESRSPFCPLDSPIVELIGVAQRGMSPSEINVRSKSHVIAMGISL